MWNKEKPDTATERAPMTAKVGNEENIIAFVGRGVEFKGAISYEGTVRIDGRVEGEIHTNGVLVVGEEATIAAKITAGTIISKGKIIGEIIAKERVKLLSPAMLQGSVQAPAFSMEEGVVFNGTCQMTGDVHELPREAILRPVGAQAQIKRISG